jgi:isoquinoline 1-oxidoreductase beta subunit
MLSAVGKSDAAAISGARPPYTIPHLAIDHLPVDSALPAGYWRSNGDSIATFITECFVDELAAVGTTDPLGFRMSMLGNATDLARCLQTVSALGGWEGGAAGSGQGIACASLRGSHIAVMAVARPGAGGLVVERLVIAADIGRVLNPSLARQAIESGAVFGLAAAIGATTRYRKGVARARHMGDLGLPKLAQMPAITVELIDSQRAPGGASEIGVVAIAPAIANALHTVTGRRIRRLPLSEKPLP